MGIFSYTPLKEGKGVREDAPKLRSPFLFFYIFGTRFFALVKLNILYILSCLFIVTIGPATAALTSVLKNYIEEKHVFLFHDYFEAFRENFFKGLGVFAINAVAMYSLYTVYVNYEVVPQFAPLLFPVLFVNLLILIMDFYIYPMMVTYDIPFFALIKNGLIFALIKLVPNVLAVLLFAGIYYVALYMYPVIGIILSVIFLPVLLWMFAIFYNRNYIKKLMEPEK